jgi:hypothetical protein
LACSQNLHQPGADLVDHFGVSWPAPLLPISVNAFENAMPAGLQRQTRRCRHRTSPSARWFCAPPRPPDCRCVHAQAHGSIAYSSRVPMADRCRVHQNRACLVSCPPGHRLRTLPGCRSPPLLTKEKLSMSAAPARALARWLQTDRPPWRRVFRAPGRLGRFRLHTRPFVVPARAMARHVVEPITPRPTKISEG